MKGKNYFLLLTVLLMSSCRMPKDLVYQNIENFSLQRSAVSVDVRLYNPNNFKLKLRHADVEVFVNGSHLGKMTESKSLTISKRDTFLLPVLLNLDMKNALPNVLQLLFNKEVNIKLTGTVTAGRRGIFITIPVHYEGKEDIKAGLKF